MASPRKRNEQNGKRIGGGGEDDASPILSTNGQPQPTPSESRLQKVSVLKSTAPTFTSSSFSFSYFPPSSYSYSSVISASTTTRGTPPPSLLNDDDMWNLEKAKGLVQNFPETSVGNDSSNISSLDSPCECSSSRSKSSPSSTSLHSTSTTCRAFSNSLRNVSTSAEFVGSSVYPPSIPSSSSSLTLSPWLHLGLKEWKSHYRQREAAFWYTMTSVCLVLTGILILQIHSRQERRWGGRRKKTYKKGSGKEEDVAKKKEMENERRHRRELEGTSSSSENCDNIMLVRESSSSFNRVNGLLLSLLGIVGIVYSSSPTWWIVALQGLRLSL